MHIASAKSGNGQSVSWFLLDRSTASLIYGLEQTKEELKLTKWATVVAVYHDGKPNGASHAGIAWTSKKDEFNVGTGMKVSLERAVESLRRADDRKKVWDFVLADEAVGSLLRDGFAQATWAVKARETMARRLDTIA